MPVIMYHIPFIYGRCNVQLIGTVPLVVLFLQDFYEAATC
jgi:hypothetical protein